jgi:hypothetical protein
MVSEDRELQKINNDLQAKENDKKKEETALERLKEKHEEKFRALSKKHEDALRQIQRQQETEMSRLKAEQSNEEGKAEQKIEGIEADIRRLLNEQADRSRELADEREKQKKAA